ncbi:MAG: S-methyl-5'-thioadenosine phosphorylase [Alphaproteobacteria bacterium]|nr:S-methyl-5'-thioadenosine phosphorylase [Alphaproteobacteria bacterium]
MAERQSGALGIIGGSGLYEIEGLANTRWISLESPFGAPSDEFLFGELAGRPLVFLPRHGRGHRLSPGAINYRANIDAMKRAGVTEILSLSAVGSLRETLAPGTFVIVDQFVDRTTQREKSFFGAGLVAHVAMAKPVCARLSQAVEKACRNAGIAYVQGGTYLVMEGPQFSTLAESEFYRSAGFDVIGMTNMPEAKLAREAEICYATVAMVTDYDCWHPDHDSVTVEAILKVLFANADRARELVRGVVPLTGGEVPCPEGCNRALDHAIVTAEDVRDAKLVARLDAVAGRVLKA